MYITKANAAKIVKKINIRQVSNLEGEVYKKPIYFLSRFEVNELLLIQTLFRDPQKLLETYYVPINKEDTFTFVFEESQYSAYHLDKDCPNLISKFKNFKVPCEIKNRVRARLQEQGKTEEEIVFAEKEQVDQFRVWFKDNYKCYESDIELFLKKLDVRWNITRKVSEVEYENSGTEVIENLNLKELEGKIDEIIARAGQFYTYNKDKQTLIKKFQKYTFLAYTKAPIVINDTKLSDEELKAFLHEYNTSFKTPIKCLLREYYRVKFNPDLSFDGRLLERLNFKPCSKCVK